MNDNKNNYDISLIDIVGMLIKRWWLIALIAIVCLTLVLAYTVFFVDPLYQASVTLLIDGGSSITTTYQDILAGQYQSKDYPYILNANLTLELLAEKLNNYSFPENDGVPYREYTSDVLASMITNESVSESRIFIVTVTSTDPNEARIIANTIVEVFPEKIETLIRGGSVGVVDLARTPSSPASPSYGKNMVFGLLAGIIIGVAIAIALGLLRDILESETWLIQTFRDDIPLLSIIPDSNARSDKYKYKYSYGRYEQKKQ